ncbi:hypothetical protein Hokovirus_2_3 [Hokovirus HKV1]|uniref:Uncharacterized protein n=1 Tax=Hokovirus HKV1 TaxID=1977638 RepID=A0A1V0SFH6_9VIRU|nr:hypothetical protein Hokovirus_2_3 [Hokovirus HKV1]
MVNEDEIIKEVSYYSDCSSLLNAIQKTNLSNNFYKIYCDHRNANTYLLLLNFKQYERVLKIYEKKFNDIPDINMSTKNAYYSTNFILNVYDGNFRQSIAYWNYLFTLHIGFKYYPNTKTNNNIIIFYNMLSTCNILYDYYRLSFCDVNDVNDQDIDNVDNNNTVKRGFDLCKNDQNLINQYGTNMDNYEKCIVDLIKNEKIIKYEITKVLLNVINKITNFNPVDYFINYYDSYEFNNYIKNNILSGICKKMDQKIVSILLNKNIIPTQNNFDCLVNNKTINECIRLLSQAKKSNIDNIKNILLLLKHYLNNILLISNMFVSYKILPSMSFYKQIIVLLKFINDLTIKNLLAIKYLNIKIYYTIYEIFFSLVNHGFIVNEDITLILAIKNNLLIDNIPDNFKKNLHDFYGVKIIKFIPNLKKYFNVLELKNMLSKKKKQNNQDNKQDNNQDNNRDNNILFSEG